MIKRMGLKNFIICLLIILQPIISQITAIMVRKNLSSITIGMLFNGIILLFGIIYVLFISKSKYKKKSILYLLLLLLFCILFFIFKYKEFNINYFKQEVIFMFKYLYYPIISVFLLNLLDSKDIEINYIENSIKICIMTYCLLILFAEFSGTSYLSYQNSYVGKIGWFYSANEIGTIFAILLPYTFLNFKQNKKINIVLILVSIFTILFIGTKTSILGIILVSILIIIYLITKVDIKKKIILISTIIIFILSLFIINPPAIKNMKQSFKYYLSFEKAEDNVQIPTNATLSFLIFSERTIFFEQEYNKFKEESLNSKLFGVGFVNNDPSVNYRNHLVEMDAFDILFKYGIIGFIIYFIPNIFIIHILFKKFIKKKIKLNFSDIIYIYIVILASGISFVAGHVLGSPSVSIFLALTLNILLTSTVRRLD